MIHLQLNLLGKIMNRTRTALIVTGLLASFSLGACQKQALLNFEWVT